MKIELAITMQPATNRIVLVIIETLPPGKPTLVKDADMRKRRHRAARRWRATANPFNPRGEKSLAAKMRLNSLSSVPPQLSSE